MKLAIIVQWNTVEREYIIEWEYSIQELADVLNSNDFIIVKTPDNEEMIVATNKIISVEKTK